MRRLTAATAAAAAAFLLVACSPDAADFKAEAEKYIESRAFSEEAKLVRYPEVTCDEPESTAEDTIFVCTASAEDGSQWVFDVEITGKSDLIVITPPTALADAAPGSTDPADSSPSTAAATPTTTAAATTVATPTTTAPAAATTTT